LSKFGVDVQIVKIIFEAFRGRVELSEKFGQYYWLKKAAGFKPSTQPGAFRNQCRFFNHRGTGFKFR
jgi:hypothetical protein